MVSIYHDSVGHGGNMLLNLAPPHNTTLPDEAMDLYTALGRFTRSCYGVGAAPSASALAHTACVHCDGDVTLTADADAAAGGTLRFDRVLLKEDMAEGHNVLAFEILADGAQIFNGTAVGRSLIVLLDQNVTAKEVTVRVTKSRAPPTFRLLSLPDPDACVVGGGGGGGGGGGCNLQEGVVIGGRPVPGVPVSQVADVAACCGACTTRPLDCVAFTATPVSSGGFECTLLKATGGKTTALPGAVSGAPKDQNNTQKLR